MFPPLNTQVHAEEYIYMQSNLKIKVKRRLFIPCQLKILWIWSSLPIKEHFCEVTDHLMIVLFLLNLRCEPGTWNDYNTVMISKKLELTASQNFWNNCFNSVTIWILSHVWNKWFNKLVLLNIQDMRHFDACPQWGIRCDLILLSKNSL